MTCMLTVCCTSGYFSPHCPVRCQVPISSDVSMTMQASLQYAQMKVQYKSKAVFDSLLRELRTAVAAKILYKDGADESKRGKEDEVPFEMVYRSFIVEFTSHLTLSAADHVHILWAHLQHTSQNLCSKIDEGFWYAPQQYPSCCAGCPLVLCKYPVLPLFMM
jgi:hypothetical protein